VYTKPNHAEDLTASYSGAQRRRKSRIYQPFPVRVRGVDASGESFEVDTTLDNLSAGGVFLRLRRWVAEGSKIFLVLHLSIAREEGVQAPRVAVRGVVIRVERQIDGSCGLAIAITRHRFL
jgi:hypothetical protein